MVTLVDNECWQQRTTTRGNDDEGSMSGPDDATCIVWALRKFFYDGYMFFLLTNLFFLSLPPWLWRGAQCWWATSNEQQQRWAMTMMSVYNDNDKGSVTGPDAVTGIVWALGMSFFMMVTCFFLLTKHFLALFRSLPLWLQQRPTPTTTRNDDDDQNQQQQQRQWQGLEMHLRLEPQVFFKPTNNYLQ